MHCPCLADPATQGPAATHMKCDDGEQEDEEDEQQPRQRRLKRLSRGIREIEDAPEEQELAEHGQRTRQWREQVRCAQVSQAQRFASEVNLQRWGKRVKARADM